MVYKVRIILDTKENIFRDVEIKDKQTLWNLHLGVKSAFSLQGDEMSMFSILDGEGVAVKTVPLEDMSDDGNGEIMSDVYLNEAFQKVGDQVHFQYGFMDLWEFLCELVEITEEKPAVNYPITVYRFGNVPLKAPAKSSAGKSSKSALLDEDFDSFDEGYAVGGSFADNDDDFDDGDDDDFSDDFYDEDSDEI